ncbi:MAG: ribosome assembly cofactor RimP [Bacteroidaceae bacterium]|nr:ribosome assembly cofactor RimP [Bacteroidaceae bacterium]
MIESKLVAGLAQQWLESKENYFLVDVNVSRDNRIVVEIDHPEGVWIDDCVELSRFIESNLDREVEDYELEVGSAGIGQPFKVLQQYVNHIGQNVEVLPRTGAKLKGVLLDADADGFVLKTQQKMNVEGKKRPVLTDVELRFKYDEINYTKYLISLK